MADVKLLGLKAKGTFEGGEVFYATKTKVVIRQRQNDREGIFRGGL